MPELDPTKNTADMDSLRYSPDDPYYRLGPVHTCLYVQVRETFDSVSPILLEIGFNGHCWVRPIVSLQWPSRSSWLSWLSASRAFSCPCFFCF